MPVGAPYAPAGPWRGLPWGWLLIAAALIASGLTAVILVRPQPQPSPPLEVAVPKPAEPPSPPAKVSPPPPASRHVVGTLDTGRVLQGSVRALAYQQELSEREQTMAAELQALAKSLSGADLDRRRRELLAELQSRKVEAERKLNAEIAVAAGRVAAERGLAAVLDRAPVVYLDAQAVVDITDDVINRLK